MTLKLVATTGNQTVTLPPGRQLLVGRSIACDLPVRDPSVSRQHAELQIVSAGLEVNDLGSTNGTFSNGVRITQTRLDPGMTVRFGSTEVRFWIG